MNRENLQKIREIVKEFFKKTSFDIELEILNPEEDTIPIQLKIDEPKFLIGQNGQTLAEIQHLLKAVLRKNIPGNFYIDVDVNNYKQKKREYLKDIAHQSADEVVLNKKEKILPSMPSYERRIIHLELANRKDIETSSLGQEPERKIVIKPKLS